MATLGRAYKLLTPHHLFYFSQMPTTELKLTEQTNGNPSQDETENCSLFALEDEGHNSEDGPASQDGRCEAANDTDMGKARVDGEGELTITPAARSRKRERDLDGVSQDSELSKKLKQDGDASGAPSQDKNKGKERFIVFVRNLKFTTTVDDITQHFSACDPPPSVAFLTLKASTTGMESNDCAFLEFSNIKALEQALELHHSNLGGRMIIVELTVAGDGKSKARLQKQRERHKRRRREKRARDGIKDEQEMAERIKKSQMQLNQTNHRYSATSGVGEGIRTETDWDMRNQVNAIPVD
ncbi:hypothetical protein M378DRAFT_155329 [Amanita muscaria Koide BX008]|uniref:RRM domain-containing protein n=1 Tax=Amanita muscaria (strain Koide BX008) TaxID=946122 RepID=A0A0C2XQ19_AMAMK|nr:hypothetical protein M378DRAFT_155329 [Amanita muscaria Koide BX008]